MNKKILLVEDDFSVVEFLKKGLDEANFEVSVALNGNSAISMASESSFDIILLDIMLPDKNGIEVCRILRSQGIKTPILFLTALGTSENIALGLNTGADDYLVKPFKFIELYARINALLRRTSYTDNLSDEKVKNTFIISDLIIDDDAKTVVRGEQKISLTATEYRLLLVLMKNKGRVLSRIDILESAWDINFNMGTNVVDVYINYLRKKIDGDFENKLIHTVVGMGYVLKEK
ncbi:response regulator transcription factor [Arcicella lustrica]|uniref:Response regulator transcription factor n=1 Tax=Arcicella lustrica TaxID=2984196 RepID=A0ABU5SMG3_9BACT|nr:response regulator transcription factor [Arcicella sp. DC25W]MEA5428503.1 response regulator transcription factor [Arcicella sp. DC25W]